MLVSPATEGQLGADLGLIGWQVLTEVYQKQQETRLVADFVDTPFFMPRGNGHRKVILRYVFVVHPRTGRLDTLVWRIDLDPRGNDEGAVRAIEWLPPQLMMGAVLKVDVREFHLGIPSECAFAVT
jgi:hypothetical protein